jgi:hypothetical protein
MNDFVLSRVATRRTDSDGITYLFPEFPRRELRRINVDFERENKEFEMATAASDLIAEVKRMWIGGIDGLDESQKAAVAQYLSRYWDKEAEPYRAAEAKARTERKRLEGSISELRKLLEGV